MRRKKMTDQDAELFTGAPPSLRAGLVAVAVHPGWPPAEDPAAG